MNHENNVGGSEQHVSVNDLPPVWPSAVQNEPAVQLGEGIQTSSTVDRESQKAMREVSNAMLNDQSTDWNGNIIAPEMMDFLNGISELPTRGVIVDISQIDL